MNKILGIALIALMLIPLSAYADNLYYTTSDIYTVHLAHVGDYIFVNNTASSQRTIIGTDQSGESVNSGDIPSTASYELHFLFPGEFAFYDKYTCQVGIIYLYDPGVQFPTTIFNQTSTSDLYQAPDCVKANAPITAPIIVNNSTNATSPVITNNNNGGTISFQESNSTLIFSSSNATYWYNQATYYKNQSSFYQNQTNTWEDKYNNLVSQLEHMLGI